MAQLTYTMTFYLTIVTNRFIEAYSRCSSSHLFKVCSMVQQACVVICRWEREPDFREFHAVSSRRRLLLSSPPPHSLYCWVLYAFRLSYFHFLQVYVIGHTQYQQVFSLRKLVWDSLVLPYISTISYCWTIFHFVYRSQLDYSVNCWWTFELFPNWV